MKLHQALVFFFAGFLLSCSDDTLRLNIQNSLDDPKINYAIARLEEVSPGAAVQSNASAGNWTIRTALDSALGSEAYTLRSKGRKVDVTGGDGTGLMYGLLQVKEQLEQGAAKMEDMEESPRFPFRAIKFNLPWSAYRKAKALEIHKETVRDLAYWESFLDMMAENRFNALTLWSLHPFPFMIRNEKYPEACEFSDEELADWTAFWTQLFAMAKERGIETYLVNWNIFVSPSFSEYHQLDDFNLDDPNKHLGKGDTTDIVKDYNRSSVTQLLNTYPDLTGLGVSLGERMMHMTPEEREQWILDVFVEGIHQADRDARFIHRLPFSATSNDGGSTSLSTEQMTRNAIESIEMPDPILTEVKFNWSHGHSTPKLIHVHGGELGDTYWNPPPSNYQLTWMIRNEDFFCLRWCEPDFIREHIKLNGHSYVGGYYLGSECYIPAMNFMTPPELSKGYAFERQWLYYKSWGRLLYNPDTPDETFISACKARYGESGETLFKALKLGSQMPLELATFFKGNWDFSLYSEGFLSIYAEEQTRGLITVNDLIKREPMDPDYLSIPAYVELLQTGASVPSGKITPLSLADKLIENGNQVFTLMESLPGDLSQALEVELADAIAWAWLSKYFGNKLKAAVAIHVYRTNKQSEDKKQAVDFLEEASNNWDHLVEVTSPVYTVMPLGHIHRYQGLPENDVRDFHWKLIQPLVHEELEKIRHE
jgi:hypothetical protein